MVENLHKISAHGGRSHGARLLAAHKDKNFAGKPAGAGATPAYRSAPQPNSALPFPVLVPPSPVVQSMPSRRDGALGNRESSSIWGRGTLGYRDEYGLEDDAEEDENNNGSAALGNIGGVTVGKRRAPGAVLGGSEVKKQAQLPTLFSRETKRQHTARLVPAGIVNLGNTCYLNSVVQVLLNMTSFMADLRDPALERMSQHLSPAGVWAALRATADKLKTATQARPTFECLKPAVEPSELRAAMGRLGSRWRSFAQQDAHEFLVELLEGLQCEVLAAEAAASGRRRMPLSETRCPAARNLGGCLMHTWTCSACGRCTRVKEPFSCLSLQLPPQGTVNLQDLVAEYLKDETIDKNCDGCSPSVAVPHTAQHHFWRLPRVLVVHIKRFMLLPQLQPAQHTQQPQGSGQQTAQGQRPAGGHGTSGLGADENENPAQASGLNVPGTPTRGDMAVARAPTAAAEAQAGAPAVQQPQAAAGSRDPSPPAPYMYAKVHTVVKVAPALDLARHCDAAGRAHVHLLEVLPSDVARRAADGDDSAAAAGGSAGPSAGRTVGGSGTAAARPLGATAGHTLDTIGGGSTCPSPSFLQPNASVLQERTVQQHGTTLAAREDLRRSILGGFKATTPGGLRLRAPESECGTSAISTGAQADGGDGAPTPHGGCVAGPNLPASVGRHAGLERRRSPLGTTAAGGSLVGPGPTSAGPNTQLRPGQLASQREPPELGLASPVLAQWGFNGKDSGLAAAANQLTPGGGLSSHTGNDRHGPAFPPPGSSGRGGPACSERKAPRSLGTGSFFGVPTGPEPPAVGRTSLGGAVGGSGSGGVLQSCNAGQPVRPYKRMCVEDPLPDSTGRRASEPADSPGLGPSKRLEEMTEEEQLALALQMSLAEDCAGGGCNDGGSGGGLSGAAARRSSGGGAGPAAPSTGAAARFGPAAPGSKVAPLDLAQPSGAASGRRESGECGRRGCVSGGSAGRGQGARGGPSSGLGGETASDNEDVVELQDESQGGCGSGPGGDGNRGTGGNDRLATSGPAMSGASGGIADGVESDCSAGQIARAGRGGAGLDRRQAARLDSRRKRRATKLFDMQGVPDVAESPAVPPQAQRRRRMGNGYGFGGVPNGRDARPVAFSVDDEDDGTTALSPASHAVKPPAPGGVDGIGGGGSTLRGCTRVAGRAEDASDEDEPVAQPEPAADADVDPEMAKALRESMKTFEAEEEARRGNTREDMEWERMLRIPEPNDDDAAGNCAQGEADAGNCTTPRRSGGGVNITGGNNAQPPPLRRRSGTEGHDGARLCAPGTGDDDGGRGGAMDALVAAAGLGSAMQGAGSAAAETARRPPLLARRNSSMDANGTGDAAGISSGFKFSFPLADAAAGGGGASTPGAAGPGGPGSRREEALDLTGGDDEDADLHKAIMLSLQEENATLEGAVGVAAQAVMDLAGDDADVNDAPPEPDRPRVLLVPDSDYEGDNDSDAEDKDGGNPPAGDWGPTLVAGSEPAAAPGGGPSSTAKPQKRRRGVSEGANGVAASVPLARLGRYRLHGVVRHKGFTPFSGHYVADVLVTTPGGATGQLTQTWYEHNDAVVSHVDFDRVREDAAKEGYLFFFVNAPKPAPSMAAAVAAAAAKPLPDDGVRV